jgi:protein gp37
MAENSKIEWTDHSWNWAQGCPKNPDSRELACKNCYMYREKTWHGQNPAVVVRSAKPTFNFPLSSKKLKPGNKIFTCSWADFFNEALDPWRDEAWDIIRKTPQYIYQILTKWTENINDRLPADWGNGWPNVWLGVTVENQQMAYKRILHLLPIPAVIKFISVEPMLESIDLASWRQFSHPYGPIKYLDWVICGGETGPGARPMHPDWVRSLRDQCQAAGVPFFFKSWGDWAYYNGSPVEPNRVHWMWPDGRHEVIGQGWKEDGSVLMCHIGKKAAGALLDGQEWLQFPERMKR